MQQKAFTLINRGMNRDLSASKVGESAAYENHNIRITATDNDTLLSVTNERGTKEISLDREIRGTLIGWNTLNEHIILFTTTSDVDAYLADDYRESETAPDYIYRIDYTDGEFNMLGQAPLYSGWLGFDVKHPIESIVYFETEEIQKIYWIDGIHVLRFMNFMSDTDERQRWVGDDTYFDSNRSASLDISVEITKDWFGNNRPNGTVQYFMTYFNKHGQETGRIWASDIIYLSPKEKGGSPDSTNTCSVRLKFSNLSDGFDHVRLYALVRTSLDGQPVAYLVSENEIDNIDGERSVTIIDSGAYMSTVNVTDLLFLGSRAIKAETMTHKDQVLFLGGLSSVDRGSVESLSKVIDQTAFEENDGDAEPTERDNETIWRSHIVSFRRSSGEEDIPYVECTGLYPYNSQLELSSSHVTTFKGGELYRFGLMFTKDDGTTSDTFWIGDKINPIYPDIDEDDKKIHRAVAVCNIPDAVSTEAIKAGYSAVTLMIAKASYADRAVKAQGIVNPTMFNLWDRYNDRLFSYSSWLNRPRGSGFANTHFEVVHNSNSPEGEIQCNYWEKDSPTPWYRVYTASKSTTIDGETVYVNAGELVDRLDGKADFDHFAVAYFVNLDKTGLVINTYSGGYVVFTLKLKGDSTLNDIPAWSSLSLKWPKIFQISSTSEYSDEHCLIRGYARSFGSKSTGNPSKKALFSKISDSISSEFSIPFAFIPSYDVFYTWCGKANKRGSWFGMSSVDAEYNSWQNAISNGEPSSSTNGWHETEVSIETANNDYMVSYYRKHLFFVDENIVTLNSPEIDTGSVILDNMDLDFRIIGAAKMSGNISDYVIETGPSKMAGTNIYQKSFSHSNPSDEVDGLVSWPLYLETGLMQKSSDGVTIPENIEDRDSSHYQWGGGIVRYWMYMWHKSGLITGFQDEEESTRYSELHNKTFANLRFAYKTFFNAYGSTHNVIFNHEKTHIRQYTALDNQYTAINLADRQVMYDANVDTGISMPGVLKYPLYYGPVGGADIAGAEVSGYDLMSSEPITLSYRSTAHAVISLGKENGKDNILPWVFNGTGVGERSDKFANIPADASAGTSAGYLPWRNDEVPAAAKPFAGKDEGYTVTPSNDNQALMTFRKETQDAGAIVSQWKSLASSSANGRAYAVLSDTDDNDYFVDVTNAVVITETDSYGVSVKITYNFPNSVSIEFSSDSSIIIDGMDASISCLKKDDGSVSGWSDVTGSLSVDRDPTVPFDASGTTFIYTFDGPENPQSDEICVIDMHIGWEQSGENFGYNIRLANNNYDGLSSELTISTADEDKVYVQLWMVEPQTTGTVFLYDPKTFTTFNYDIETGKRTAQNSLRSVASVTQVQFVFDDADFIKESDKYLFVGELYLDPESEAARNTLYNGITNAAVQTNTFIPASNLTMLSSETEIIGNRGDTFFQRWDFLKTKPTSSNAENGVIDIVSAMVESHINLDGRHDNLRGTSILSSIDPEKFNMVNPAYSQPDDFITASDLDEDFNLDTYDSSITWTLQKADSANVDAWTHITLASTMSLDGDRGKCRALRRFQNSIIAFQDKAISEILFNSRAQIATTEGVPIEIANTGKVDGKRYVSNKYGCTNKWSIVEGKAALYFVDNINKAFCAFNNNIEALSIQKGFSAWFRRRNNTASWTPDEFGNFVSFYDRINSDVYLIGKEDEDGRPTLVYNETIGEFTSFYDYDSVPMMANVGDKFVSFKNNKLWLQNEGKYCNFFGNQYDYWVQYRVTPNPYTDKIWSGIDYRADFYHVLDEEGRLLFQESEMIGGDLYDGHESVYKENETFDNLKIWNEYQEADIMFGKDYYSPNPARKKFRIWRLTIPRAKASDTNRFGRDRIRNPWVNIMLKKKLSESTDPDTNRDLMQLHDIVVRYYE